MNVAGAVKSDITNMFKPTAIQSVYKEIGLEYRKSIRKNNRESIDPDGSPRAPLSDEFPHYYASNKQERKGNRDPNLIYDGVAESSLKVLTKNDGIEMYHEGIADSYMSFHERGEQGMPKRRQFPTTEDSESATQKPNVLFVEDQILKHLNSPRRIIVHG